MLKLTIQVAGTNCICNKVRAFVKARLMLQILLDPDTGGASRTIWQGPYFKLSV